MTPGQREVLLALTVGPSTVRQITHELALNHAETWNSVHARVRRCEDHEWARRITDPPKTRWELTHAGRQALET